MPESHPDRSMTGVVDSKELKSKRAPRTAESHALNPSPMHHMAVNSGRGASSALQDLLSWNWALRSCHFPAGVSCRMSVATIACRSIRRSLGSRSCCAKQIGGGGYEEDTLALFVHIYM